MYDRNVAGQTLTFEASGGLINSSLVLQDRETDSYWPIMRGSAVAGDLAGTRLKELAVNKKMKWKDWRRKHPDTLVLSVAGREDDEPGYEKYFRSDEGFRGSKAADPRLATKDSIFAFRWQGESYAAPFSALNAGRTWAVKNGHVFLYRTPGESLHSSTIAYVAAEKFENRMGTWHATANGCVFNPDTAEFEGTNECPQILTGFDTFWYNWSLNNPDTVLLSAPST